MAVVEDRLDPLWADHLGEIVTPMMLAAAQCAVQRRLTVTASAALETEAMSSEAPQTGHGAVLRITQEEK